MRNEVPELFKFVQGQITEANIMIALDVSGSMAWGFVDNEPPEPGEQTRLENAQEALMGVLDTIGALAASVEYPVNVRLTAWANSHTSFTRNDIDADDIQPMKDWINGRNASGGTNFEAALTPGLSFFPTDRPAQNTLFFITDGLPNEGTVENALNGPTGDLVASGSGNYTRVKGTGVSVFGINIYLTNTSETLRIDNTPQDGVPVIADGNPAALQAAIENALLATPIYTWNYTSADRDIVYNGELYEAVAIGRNAPESGNDMGRANLSIHLPRDNPIADSFLRYVGDGITSVTVFQVESEQDVFVFWRGRVASNKVQGNEVTLECESVFTSLRRPGLRARFQRNCRHTLYGSGCGLNKESFRYDGTYESLNDTTLVAAFAASQPSGFFNGGLVRAPDGSSRYILNHSGSTLILSRRLERLEENGEPGVSVISLFPGCPKTRNACMNRFNNLNNFGGFPWIPNKNPFGGSSIV